MSLNEKEQEALQLVTGWGDYIPAVITDLQASIVETKAAKAEGRASTLTIEQVFEKHGAEIDRHNRAMDVFAKANTDLGQAMQNLSDSLPAEIRLALDTTRERFTRMIALDKEGNELEGNEG